MGATRAGTLAIVGGLAGASLLAVAVGRAEAADARATVHMAVDLGPRAAVFADPADVVLVPGESATVLVTVKARVARGEALPIVLDAPWGGASLRYRFQGGQGTLSGPTTLGVLTGSGVHRIPLTIALDPAAPGPVRLPLAVRVAWAHPPPRSSPHGASRP